MISGLFGAGGPPVVIHLYRQPSEFATLRSTIMAILGVMTISRITFETYLGNIDLPVLELSLLAVPTTVIATLFARRFPPPVSELTMRRMALVLLASLGMTLILTRM